MTIKTISAENFINLFRNQDLIIVDVRTPAEIRDDALASIIHLPLDQFNSDKLAGVLKEKPESKSGVYFICESGKRARMAAEKYDNTLQHEVFIIEGGMKAIRNVQGKTITNKQMSIERQVRLSAGTLIVLGVIIGYLITPFGFAVSGLIGLGLVFSAITDTCAMAYLVMKAPWNQ